ncbi:MAG: hypothetical protein OEY93_09105, partial [Anaerolineae bacterium]|nr:hypothetical protein [Anaerolineae bacterium]
VTETCLPTAGYNYAYTYDATGNRLSETVWGLTTTTYTYDEGNRLTHVDAVDPLTDPKTHVYDANGNLVSDPNATYAYDAANRLATLTQTGGSVYTYTYNGLGDRLSQTVDSGTPTKYTLDIARGLTQVLSDGTTTYLYGAGRIGQFDTAWTYPLGDALGSVRQLSDAAGTVILAQNYAPYGSVISSFGTGASSYGFAGEWTDATGLQHLRARYMDPGTARFISRDTWGGDYNNPMSLNRWMYVMGNPVNYMDPSGKFASSFADFSVLDNAAERWEDVEMALINDALQSIAYAYARAYAYVSSEYLEYSLGSCDDDIPANLIPGKISPESAFLLIHDGKISFRKGGQPNTAWAVASGSNIITLFPDAALHTDGDDSYENAYEYFRHLGSNFAIWAAWKRFIMHEVGHNFDNAIGDAGENLVASTPAIKGGSIDQKNGFYGTAREGWQRRLQHQNENSNEIFADMFVGWVYEMFETIPSENVLTEAGKTRSDFMTENISKWIKGYLNK